MSFVSYELDGDLARITLTDPDNGNCVHIDSVTEVFAAVRRAERDRARVILLSAQGCFFSVGGDLAGFAGAEDMVAYIDDLADLLHRVISLLQRAEAVVVCAVQGTAAGAGFPLAATADIIVAADSAAFVVGYGKVGLSVDGGTSLLVNTLGLHTTLRLTLLGDSLTAQEALAAGLVARVVPDAELHDTTEEIVDRLLTLPAGSQTAMKRLVREAAGPAPEWALRREAISIRKRAATKDAREGIAAFLEKRAPTFSHD